MENLRSHVIGCDIFLLLLAISLHAGANLVDVSRALGHSSVAVTSIYLHSSDAAVSELIDLSTSMDGEDTIDESITYVKTERKKKIKSQKNTEKSQKKKSQFVTIITLANNLYGEDISLIIVYHIYMYVHLLLLKMGTQI